MDLMLFEHKDFLLNKLNSTNNQTWNERKIKWSSVGFEPNIPDTPGRRSPPTEL